jgi:hypothetical protein
MWEQLGSGSGMSTDGGSGLQDMPRSDHPHTIAVVENEKRVDQLIQEDWHINTSKCMQEWE